MVSGDGIICHYHVPFFPIRSGNATSIAQRYATVCLEGIQHRQPVKVRLCPSTPTKVSKFRLSLFNPNVMSIARNSGNNNIFLFSTSLLQAKATNTSSESPIHKFFLHYSTSFSVSTSNVLRWHLLPWYVTNPFLILCLTYTYEVRPGLNLQSFPTGYPK